MKMLQYVLVLTVVMNVNLAMGQEGDKPKDKPLPWWKLGDDATAKDETPAKKDMPDLQKAGPDKKDSSPVTQRLRQLEQLRVAQGRNGAPPARSQSGGPQPRPPALRPVAKPEPRERLVYRLANAPCMDVARTVNELMQDERAIPGNPPNNTIVISDVISNSLIISGTPEAIHETVKLVEQLDAEPLMVHVEAVIGLIESREGLSLLAPNPEGPELSCSHAEACELIEQFSKSDAVKILARPQVMTLDNQPAFFQIGQRVPRVTSRKDGTTTTELENVGIILGLTPRISPDHVVTMEIDLEKSDLGAEDQGVPLGVDSKGNVVRSPAIDVASVQTTVKIPPGRAVIIGGIARKDGDKQGELVVVVTPHVVARKK